MGQPTREMGKKAGMGTKTVAKTQTYVEYIFPGSLFCETWKRPVKGRDPLLVLPKLPVNAFAFRFFERVEAKHGNKLLRGERENDSGTFFVDAEVMTLEDVNAKMPEAGTLIRNMEGNMWEVIVKTRMGNFQPFEKGDCILRRDGKVLAAAKNLKGLERK